MPEAREEGLEAAVLGKLLLLLLEIEAGLQQHLPLGLGHLLAAVAGAPCQLEVRMYTEATIVDARGSRASRASLSGSARERPDAPEATLDPRPTCPCTWRRSRVGATRAIARTGGSPPGTTGRNRGRIRRPRASRGISTSCRYVADRKSQCVRRAVATCPAGKHGRPDGRPAKKSGAPSQLIEVRASRNWRSRGRSRGRQVGV